MMRTYVEQVTENYGTNFQEACAEIDGAFNLFYVTLDAILKENKFPDEQATKWGTLLNTASTKAAELKLKIEEKYRQMTDKAQEFEDLYQKLCGFKDKSSNFEEIVGGQKVVTTATVTDVTRDLEGEGYPKIIVSSAKTVYSKVYPGADTPEKDWVWGNPSAAETKN